MRLHINSRGKLVEDSVYRGILDKMVSAMKIQIMMEEDKEIFEILKMDLQSGNKEE